MLLRADCQAYVICLFAMFYPTSLAANECGVLKVSSFLKGNARITGRTFESRDGYWVLETSNHRIAKLNNNLEVLSQVGSIGQGPGELYYPTDAVYANDRMHVLDTRNRRVQIYSGSGRLINQFPIDAFAHGIAVNLSGEIFLGQPKLGKLVTVYSSSGKLLRQFGELKKLSTFFGPSVADLDFSYRTAINRIYLAIDSSNNTHLAFIGAPFHQIYGQDGKLKFENQLAFPEADMAISEFRLKRTAPSRATFFLEDTVPIPNIVTGLSLSATHEELYLSVQWKSSWVQRMNLAGMTICSYSIPQHWELRPHDISVSKDGHRIFAPNGLPNRRDEVRAITFPSGR
jgi:hypothetical protein